MDKITISCDDFHPLNWEAERIADKYGLKILFFIDCKYQQAIDQIIDLHQKGHKIGSHTITHPSDIKELTQEDLEWEISGSKEIIENAIGDKIEWFCYPKGRFDEKVKQQVEDSGFLYARTVNLKDGQGPYEKGGYHMYRRKEYNISWDEEIIQAIRQGKTNHVWFHAWEIDKNREWDKLEKVFKEIKHENISRK